MGKQICVAVIAIAGIGAPVRGQMSAPSMVAALPNVSTQSPANSAGVLEYCVRHQLVSSVSASAILEKLNKHGNIQSSSDYGAGLAGQVRTQVGGNFLFERAAGHLQSQMCDRVLNHAKEL